MPGIVVWFISISVGQDLSSCKKKKIVFWMLVFLSSLENNYLLHINLVQGHNYGTPGEDQTHFSAVIVL